MKEFKMLVNAEDKLGHIRPEIYGHFSEANYILMSTCAYVFEDARSVLLGKLVPLASAGGKALTQ